MRGRRAGEWDGVVVNLAQRGVLSSTHTPHTSHTFTSSQCRFQGSAVHSAVTVNTVPHTLKHTKTHIRKHTLSHTPQQPEVQPLAVMPTDRHRVLFHTVPRRLPAPAPHSPLPPLHTPSLRQKPRKTVRNRVRNRGGTTQCGEGGTGNTHRLLRTTVG